MRHASSVKLAFPYQTFSFYWFDEGRATHCLSLNNVIIQQKLDVIHCRQDVDVLWTHHILVSQMALTVFHHSSRFPLLYHVKISNGISSVHLFKGPDRDSFVIGSWCLLTQSFALWLFFLLGKLKFCYCPTFHTILGKSSGSQIY